MGAGVSVQWWCGLLSLATSRAGCQAGLVMWVPGDTLGGVQALWQPAQPQSSRPAARAAQAASHCLPPHRSLPSAFASPLPSTMWSSAPTRRQHRKIGLVERCCSRSWPPSPELKAAPLLISDPTSIHHVQGLAFALFLLPFGCLFLPCFGCKMLQSAHPAGNFSSVQCCPSLGWDVLPALPHEVLRGGQTGLKPQMWCEFGLIPPIRKRQLCRCWGRMLRAAGELGAGQHRGTAAISPGTGDQLVSVPVFAGGFKGSGCPLVPVGGPGW